MTTNKARAWVRGVLVTAAVGLVAAGCASAATPDAGAGANAGGSVPPATVAGGSSVPPTSAKAAGVVFPGAEWATTDPASAGFDQAALDEMTAKAKAANSNCLLVTRHGKIVSESYFNEKDATSAQEVFSATKSYTSTLVGIAQGEGKLDIDDSASKYIPEWAGTPAEKVTVKNLLSNDSGRFWDYETDYLKMAAGAPDKDKFAIDLTQASPPGETWVYNNSAIQTLDAVLKNATGQDTAAYAKAKLFDPIGMTHSDMKHDSVGNTLTFMGLNSTCRDMARFGYLALNKGMWDGKQVLPAGWVDEATQSSQKLNSAYGYLWWLNRKGTRPAAINATTGQPEPEKTDVKMVEDAPENVFWALGLGNQMIAVYPDTGVVAVRLGPIPAKGALPFGTSDLTLGTQKALTKP